MCSSQRRLGKELAPHTSNKADIMCASQRRLGKELARHTSIKADIMGASQRRLGKKLAPNTSVPVSRVWVRTWRPTAALKLTLATTSHTCVSLPRSGKSVREGDGVNRVFLCTVQCTVPLQGFCISETCKIISVVCPIGLATAWSLPGSTAGTGSVPSSTPQTAPQHSGSAHPGGMLRRRWVITGTVWLYTLADSSPALRLCSSWWDAQEEESYNRDSVRRLACTSGIN